jgi:hypothetical protein
MITLANRTPLWRYVLFQTRRCRVPTVDYRLHASAHHDARAPPRRYAKFVEDATLTFTMLFFIEMILKYDCP